MLTPAPAATPSMGGPRMSDSSHWYAQDGGKWSPLYTPEKNYTLREARKDKEAGKVVMPSVTTYFKVLHKQALLDWKMEQVAKAAWLGLQMGHHLMIDEAGFIDSTVSAADNASKPAADRGTAIHAAIENCIAGEPYDAAMEPYVVAAMKEREALGIKSLGIETACGSLEHGYAGKCDEHAEGMTVLDHKSRKSGKQKTPKVASYSTDRLQLSAYGYALFGDAFFLSGRGIILGISTTNPGLVTPHVFTGPELLPAFEAFLALCAVWRFENNFDPRITTSNESKN